MRSHALSALSLVVLATSTTAANQLHMRQETDCLDNLVSLVQAGPTVPSALADNDADGDCIPPTLTAVASSFASEAGAWYTSILNAISACPAYPATAAPIPTLFPTDFPVCSTGDQTSSSRGATATLSSTSSSNTAVATSTSPTRASSSSSSSGASQQSKATTSSSQSANAAARETGALFAAVAVAALGAAAL